MGKPTTTVVQAPSQSATQQSGEVKPYAPVEPYIQQMLPAIQYYFAQAPQLYTGSLVPQLTPAQQQAQASQLNTPVNQFLANLQSRIYAQISQNLATAMFSPGAATSGSMNFQGNTIFWQNLGNSISLVVTDNLGNQTSISVPLGSFTFTQPGAGQ